MDYRLLGFFSGFPNYRFPHDVAKRLSDYVIDNRMEASHAMQLIHEASSVFLMGGHPGLQLQLIRDKGLDAAICGATVTVLGVSAGANFHGASHLCHGRQQCYFRGG